MAANTALLLTINLFADMEAQGMGFSAADLATVRQARSAQLTLYMLVLLPAAMVAGTALSWLRLNLWVKPVLKKFRCGWEQESSRRLGTGCKGCENTWEDHIGVLFYMQSCTWVDTAAGKGLLGNNDCAVHCHCGLGGLLQSLAVCHGQCGM